MFKMERGLAQLEGEEILARNADRSAGNEATLVWMLSWGVLFVVSFPLRWSFGLIAVINIPMTGIITLLLSGMLGIAWYRLAGKQITRIRETQARLRREKEARQREEHLAKLRARQAEANQDSAE